MRIALFPNEQKDKSLEMAAAIVAFFHEARSEVYASDAIAKKINASPLSKIDPSKLEFLISMGGDGTILHLFHSFHHLEVPILGVNLGGLGFLADITLDNLFPSLSQLLEHAYTIDKRLFIEGDVSGKKRSFAINEIAVHRGQVRHLIDLAVHIDGTYVNTFAADGLIIATPSGSTAYSLAAGGPILTPELEALVLTPISPHTISNRPIVLMPKEEIQVQLLSTCDPVEVTFDGATNYPLHTGELLRIQPSKKRFSLVHLKQNDYFATLRTKLDWRGRLKIS